MESRQDATVHARFSPLRASPSTKVMLAQMGLEFARRATGTPLATVTWVGVNPGAVRTGNIDQMGPWARRLVLPLIGWLLRPVAEGAAPLVWAATARDATQASGTVFDRRGRPLRMRRTVTDAATAKRLWDASEQLLGLQPLPSI